MAQRPSPRPHRDPAWARVRAAVAGSWRAQRGRGPLWVAAAYVMGAAVYFSLPIEPDWRLWPVLGAPTFLILAATLLWPTGSGGWSAGRWMCLGASLLAAAALMGAGTGAAHTRLAQGPGWAGGEAPVLLSGWVEARDRTDVRVRLTLAVTAVEGGAGGDPPRRVRVSLAGDPAPTPGRHVQCRAVLRPPDGPIAPGGYDFARRAYFDRLDATGFVLGRCRIQADAPAPGWLRRTGLWLAALRWDLTDVVQAQGGGQGGALAAALITGDRSFLDADTSAALRDSGLAHLISVSGLHMALVGGVVFVLLHRVLALIGPLALRSPVKKWAALGAILALSLYLVISGASVPAQRAYIMALVAFGAILIDRPALSLRGVAASAVIVTALTPAAVLEPGYQMSFAATLALVAAFEAMRGRGDAPPSSPGPLIATLERIRAGLLGAAMTSLIAGLATDPFGLYHFQRISLYGLPANVAAAPIISFAVAPAAVLAALLAPFGLAEPVLEVMARALELVIGIGQAFGDRPEAVIGTPAVPGPALACATAGLVWACLVRGRAALLAVGFIGAAAAISAAAPRAALLFDGELRAVVAREAAGGWTAAQVGRSRFALERVGGLAGLAPRAVERLSAPEGCGPDICRWRLTATREAVWVRTPAGFDAPCAPEALVLTALTPPSAFIARCQPAALVDNAALSAQGGGAVALSAEGFLIRRSRPASGDRPWSASASAR